MFTISYAEDKDKDFWFSLDKHICENEFKLKVRDKRGYVIRDDNKPVGILRYGLFWEDEMCLQGFKAVMTSTQVDEDAQHFYRKLGYKDVGCLVLDIPEYEQPMEMFMLKSLNKNTNVSFNRR